MRKERYLVVSSFSWFLEEKKEGVERERDVVCGVEWGGGNGWKKREKR